MGGETDVTKYLLQGVFQTAMFVMVLNTYMC